MNTETLTQIQMVFAKDRFATDNGAVIDQVDEGFAKCSLEIQPHHLNAAGTVMGGAIFTLADFAFAVASNWNKPLHVSTTAQITYLGIAKGTRLIAEARKVKEGRSTCYYLVEVTDDLGNAVAHVTSSGFSRG
ncbi:MAG: PaaI family thioesterase [Clostridium sp.]|nr:PaaI family thioesterase [Clostridium sp.]